MKIKLFLSLNQFENSENGSKNWIEYMNSQNI